MMRALYRISQGLKALFAFVFPVDMDAVEQVLTPELRDLFLRMSRRDQQHSIDVMKKLQSEGYTHPDLLTAALLHDVGKSRYSYGIPERTANVLAKLFFPVKRVKWGQSGQLDWRRVFVIARLHPDWSAEDMQAAGASPLAVSLARRHQDKFIEEAHSEEDRLLRALQRADDEN